MNRCESFRGEIAAALYEPLAPEAQAQLDAHLGSCAACRAEAEALRHFVAKLPAEVPDFTGDLLPAVREELRRDPTAARFAWRVWAPLGIAAMLVVGVFVNLPGNPPTTVDNPADNTEMVLSATTPAESIAEKAYELTQSGKAAAARTLLHEAIDKNIGAPALLLQALGDIEFDHGQRYEQAFDAYDSLKRDHPQQWAASPAALKNRYDLLAEVKPINFDPLLQLNAARTFENYENILARSPKYPMVSTLAVARMEALVIGDATTDAATRVAALEDLRERCTEPLAVAQLSISLGDVYWKEMDDPTRARALYQEAATAPDTALALRAETNLDILDRATQP